MGFKTLLVALLTPFLLYGCAGEKEKTDSAVTIENLSQVKVHKSMEDSLYLDSTLAKNRNFYHFDRAAYWDSFYNVNGYIPAQRGPGMFLLK